MYDNLSVTLILIGITVLVSWNAFSNRPLMERMIFWPPAITRRREYWRLLSYGFVHADGQHLLFNMITLYFFGRVMEGLYSSIWGPLGFVLFYAGGLVVSILPTYFDHRDDAGYRSLGASGAVSAVLFAFILIQPWALIYIFFVPMPAVLYAVLYLGYTFYMDRKGGDNVNHSAHLWGAMYGIAITLVMRPELGRRFLQQLFNP